MPRERRQKADAPVQKTPSAPRQPMPQEEEILSGLYLFGTVIDRTRRTIHTRNGDATAEIVTYTIQDNTGRRYYVDEYSPEEYYELGEYADVPVYVKTFKKRTGDVSYSFCVQTDSGPTRGEHF